tara:strand:- start:2182 stop:2658 length:477 start_codon:yes stop_codon:yes gene_type:complete
MKPSDQAWQAWMKRLLHRAEQVGREGEVPVSAIVLNSRGQCIGRGSNQREKHADPLGHAELIALKQAAHLRGDWRFNDCTLIVTLEPCPMCAGALVQARMGCVVFGAHDNKRGGLGGTVDLANHPSAHHKMEVIGGVMEAEARQLLEIWFKQRRQRNR